MDKVVIVDGCRTAVGKIGGTLKTVLAEELARVVMKAVLERTGVDPAELDEVIFGHARQSSDNPNIARLAALRAGIPEAVPAYTVMRQCASGMTAINNGFNSILAGQCDAVLAGGAESMSTAPFYIRNARYGLGTGNALLLDSVTEVQPNSQPQEIYGTFGMGMTAENVAEQFGVSREAQDAFAMQSQERAAAAIAAGKFKGEIVPVTVPQRRGDPVVFDTDEFPKQTTLEKLASLPAAFKEGGTVTAGNSSGRNDGASAVLIMKESKAEALGLKPLARIVTFANAGLDPRIMGVGPVYATRKALKQAGMTIDQIDLVELNEAFAAQSVASVRELGLDEKLVNVNGGAIALGHPIGSSGCRIIVTLAHELMKRDGARFGLATLCIAGGLGSACIIEKM
ncbi:MAG: thiolase family protein [Clostridiales Family XIII bacterium]|jgi:acetyl-CoA C-acetyltransferase|nr:thiolase family protein [Clostridiales Family XIII bacterium]